jgi:origin recognition complex subunit 1
MVRINYAPYTPEQLVKIVQSRLDSVAPSEGGSSPMIIFPDAIMFAAKKVSGISGDARRILEICRLGIDLVSGWKD